MGLIDGATQGAYSAGHRSLSISSHVLDTMAKED